MNTNTLQQYLTRIFVFFVALICSLSLFSLVSIAQEKTGFGVQQSTEHQFEITFDPDMWTMTDTRSFVVSGTVKAFTEVTPHLAVVYGTSPQALTQLASNNGKTFFHGLMNTGDSISFKSEPISVVSLEKDIQNNTVYFALVDAGNKDIAYTQPQSVELNAHTGATTYGIDLGVGQEAPGVAASGSNGGLLAGICKDVSTCGFNDLLKLFTNFWKFILILIIPLMALMTAWIGFNFMQQGAEYREKAKEMAGNMIKGVLLILFAWFIVNTILTFVLKGGKDSCYTFLGKGKIDPNCLDAGN